ncbi:MAG: 50S ribosomal protein L11 methyltransferase [Candidatus Acidiferrales bacterium]
MLDEHRLYLSDLHRTSLFRQAISVVVRPGDIVLDLACGTGVLGLLAMKAGAAKVYQVDQTPMIQVARDVAAANGYGQSTFGIHENSGHAKLPEKADVVVADQLSHFGIGAGMPEIFNDARRRLLKPGARAIPRRLELFLAPVNFPEMWRIAGFWNQRHAGLTMSPARSIAFNIVYPSEKSPRRMLGRPVHLVTFDLTDLTPERFTAKAEIRVSTAGVMHGLSGWFDAELAPGIMMTNSPFSKSRIKRPAVFFPIEKPVMLKKGEILNITMTAITAQNLISWKFAVLDTKSRARAQFAHSTLKGMVLMRDELAKTRPDFVPRLSDWGLARRSAVNLADGARTLAEIEREMVRIHSALFPSLAEASEFVAKLLLPDALGD